MDKIYFTRRPINQKELVKKKAFAADTSKIIEGNCEIYIENEKQIVCTEIQKEQPYLSAIKSIKYSSDERTGGLKTTSRIFGFSPRVAIRKDFCSSCRLSTDHPNESKIIFDLARLVSASYEINFPERFYKQKEILQKEVLPEWVIPGTVFTSGIINKNNNLKYHYDAGNYEGLASCMVVFRDGLEGGDLSIPEIDAKIRIKNLGLIMFDGQSILHGVTPIFLEKKNSYRYSVVFYSLKTMRNCLTVQEEINRIRLVKRQRELKRASAE